MRDRLIELINQADDKCGHTSCGECGRFSTEYDCAIGLTADYLLANGVIVPPCKVGDTVYYITGINNTLVSGAKVTGIYYDNNDFVYYVCVGCLHFTLQQSETYFTREEAERALKGGKNGTT